MRMRKKRHREERLAACAHKMFPADQPLPLDFIEAAPLHIEIGCGKGSFVTQMALNHPDIHYIALEKVPDVLILAMEREEQLPNLRFVLGDAAQLSALFPPNSAERIYLNFSDPWPKSGQAKRRLTAPSFLEQYRLLLQKNGAIFLKTDNRNLFEYSLETLQAAEFTLRQVTYDLHQQPVEDDVMTEYETLFSSQGMPIHRLEAWI